VPYTEMDRTECQARLLLESREENTVVKMLAPALLLRTFSPWPCPFYMFLIVFLFVGCHLGLHKYAFFSFSRKAKLKKQC